MSMNTSSSRRVFSNVVVTGLALAWGLATAPLNAQECPPRAGRSAAGRIVDVVAEGVQLGVSLSWRDTAELRGAAVLRMRDADGREVARRVIRPRAGETTVAVLDSALADLDLHGLEYRVDVDRGLVEPFDLRVRIDCEKGKACRPRVSENVYSGALALEAELTQALESVEPSSADILAEVMARHPLLTGQVITLALQMAALDERYGIPLRTCSCFWGAEVDATPSGQQQVTLPSGSSAQSWVEAGPGASGCAAVLSQSGGLDLTMEGRIAMTLDTRCWQVTDWSSETVDVDVQGWPTGRPVLIPVLATCKSSCQGLVTHEVAYEGRAGAVARDYFDGSPKPSFLGAETFASEVVEYLVDGDVVFKETNEAAARVSTGLRLSDSGRICRSGLRQGRTPSMARLGVRGEIALLASDEGTTKACAAGALSNGYLMTARAEAGCAIPNEASVTVTGALLFPFSDRSVTATRAKAERSGLLKEPWCR